MTRQVGSITLALALISLTGCAAPGTTDDSRSAAVVAPLPHETCPTCGRAPSPAASPTSESVPIRFEPSCWVPPSQWSELPPSALGDRPPPVALPDQEALEKARVHGAYKTLLRTVAAPGDYVFYGEFYDYGRWEGTAYAGYGDLPPGDWVYVYPHWYIWDSTTARTRGNR